MLNPFRSGTDPHPLVVGMTGVKLGERFAQIGCAHGGRLAAIAAKVGLSGRAVAIVADEAAAARARKGAADAGVLIEVELAPFTQLPVEDAGFDLVVLDDTDGMLGSMPTDTRGTTVVEARRILRPGGRLIVIGSTGSRGLAALLARTQPVPRFDPAPALQTGGFRSVRILAEREGLVFVEGIRPRQGPD